MGKVKQAIVDVHEEVADIVQGSLEYRVYNSANIEKKPISLPDLQTLLFKKYWHKNNNEYFLNEDVVIEAYNKALEQLENI
jgi:hypothetical protein